MANKVRYFDTHAHLNLPPLVEKVEHLLKDLQIKDTWVNIVGVDGPSSQKAYELASSFFNAVCSVAIHPNDVAELGDKLDEHLAIIESLLANDSSHKIVCVGETGLDKSRSSDLSLQKASFQKHIALAQKYNKPLNIHCRDAHEEMVQMLNGVVVPSVIHCFTAGPKEALAYAQLGCFVSIPGVVTFKNAIQLQEAVRLTPWQNLLVETDSPYLAPVPFRGKTNSPVFLPFIVAKIAELKGVSEQEASEILFANALRAFGMTAEDSALKA